MQSPYFTNKGKQMISTPSEYTGMENRKFYNRLRMLYYTQYRQGAKRENKVK